MATIPSKVAGRMSAVLKRFQPILSAAKSRDINESDTVVIITDLLHDLFGYDKYSEITSEHMIRGTFCDLAVKVEGTLAVLIEAKAIGLELKDAYVKQAVDYAANQGVEWVVLTNAVIWRAYKVNFGKPIEHELVVEFNLCELNPKSQAHLELLWLLAKEGWQKARLSEYHSQRQALSRFTLAAILQTEPVLEIMRRELRRLAPGIRIDTDEVWNVLQSEVLKREVLEGEKAGAARRQVSRAAARALRSTRPVPASDDQPSQEEDPQPEGSSEVGP